MIGIGVRDMARPGPGRDDERRDAGAVAEVVERLDVAGVVVAAAFVEGDEDGGALPQFLLAWTASTIFFTKPSNRFELGRGRVAVEPAVGFTNETAGRVPFWISLYRSVVSWMCARPAGIGHDRGGVLEGVADVAVGVVGELT